MTTTPAPDVTAAACRDYDTEQFFIEGLGSGIANRQAKAICNGQAALDIPPCPVREACLAWALAQEGTLTGANRYGVFGGLTAQERGRLVRQGMTAGKRAKRAA